MLFTFRSQTMLNSVSDRGWKTSLIKLAQHKHITVSDGCNLTGQVLSLFFKYY